MLSTLKRGIRAVSPTRAEALGLVLILIGGAVDFLTSDAYSPLFFYIPPIILVAWASPSNRGWLHVGLIAVSVLVVSSLEASPGKTASVVYNSLTLVATVALVFWAIKRLRLSMRDLEEAKARLETLNQEKNILFGIISHDLRGPLSVLLTFSRLIGRSVDRLPLETIQMLAKEHQDAAQKVFALLENLLEWARVQMGSAVMGIRPVDVEQAAMLAIEPLLPMAAQKGVAVTIDDIPPELHVAAEERALATVLRNLVSNAIKFTPSGGSVRIAVAAGGGDIVMTVSDSGIGMAEDKVKALFAVRDNAPSRGTNDEYGAGLGLILCKEILARFGGRIEVESEVGKGTTFAIIVPRSRDDGAEVTKKAA